MNVAVLSGHLVDNAQVRGKTTKALAFILETIQISHNGEGEKEIKNLIPCVLFNPSPEIEMALAANGKGTLIEFQGRLNSSKYEQSDRARYSCEVVVFNKSLVIIGPPI